MAQAFAVNGGMLNGDSEVHAASAPAQLSVVASGDMYRGATGEGLAQVSLTASGTLAVAQSLEGGSSISFTASGTGHRGATGAGLAQLQVKASGAGVLHISVDGYSPIALEAQGNPVVAIQSPGHFQVQLLGQGEAAISPAVFGEGIGQIWLATGMDGSKHRSVMGEGLSRISVRAPGDGSLIINNLDTEPAVLAFGATGEARLAERISLEGVATIGVRARGELGVRRYVYGEGHAQIRITMHSKAAGRPPIPAEYIETPKARCFVVPKEHRINRVAPDNRSFEC